MILTPLQQIKDNYYKMSESQFHYWMSQNIETLMKQERDIIVNTYNREPIDGIQNWFIRDGERYYELNGVPPLQVKSTNTTIIQDEVF